MSEDVRDELKDIYNYAIRNYIPHPMEPKDVFQSTMLHLKERSERTGDLEDAVGAMIFMCLFAFANGEEPDVNVNEYMKITSADERNTYNRYVSINTKNTVEYAFIRLQMKDRENSYNEICIVK